MIVHFIDLACLSCIPKDLCHGKSLFCGKCSKAGNMERAEALVADMEEHGLEATLGLYNMMMDGYAHCRAEVQCLDVFRKLKARTHFLLPFANARLEG